MHTLTANLADRSPERDLGDMMADLADRLTTMQFRVAEAAPAADPAHVTPTAEAIEGLQSALEEMRVAQEEVMTARAEAEAERTRYRDLFAFAPDGYLVTSARGTIIEANEAAVALLGVPGPFIIGKPMVVYVHKADRLVLADALMALRAQDRGEWTLRMTPRRAAAEIVVHATAGAVRNWLGEVEALRWMLRDVTRQKREEEELQASRQQLRSMAQRLAQAEERERQRIATEIHDTIGQTLAVAKLKLGMLREDAVRANIPKARVDSLDEVRRMLAEALQQTRTLTLELSPSVLYELGLGAAIEWMLEQRAGLGVRFEFANQAQGVHLRRDAAVLLFQTVRELVANVVKHARATVARVRLTRAEGGVSVEVEDDGAGFDVGRSPAARAKAGSFGLFSIQERVGCLGGNLHIHSEVGGGTRVRIDVPVPAPRRPRKSMSHHKAEP